MDITRTRVLFTGKAVIAGMLLHLFFLLINSYYLCGVSDVLVIGLVLVYWEYLSDERG